MDPPSPHAVSAREPPRPFVARVRNLRVPAAAAVQHNARTLSGPPSTRATVAMDGGVADTARANTTPGTVPVNTGNHTGTCSAPRDELPIRIHTDPQAHSEAGLLSSSIAIERHRAAQEDAAALLATPRDPDPWTQSLRPADLLSLAAEDGIQPAPPGLPWIHTVTRTWAGPAPSSHLTLFPNSHLVRRLCGGAENCRNLSGI